MRSTVGGVSLHTGGKEAQGGEGVKTFLGSRKLGV